MKNKHSGFLVPFIAILIAVLIAAGYFVYRTKVGVVDRTSSDKNIETDVKTDTVSNFVATTTATTSAVTLVNASTTNDNAKTKVGPAINLNALCGKSYVQDSTGKFSSDTFAPGKTSGGVYTNSIAGFKIKLPPSDWVLVGDCWRASDDSISKGSGRLVFMKFAFSKDISDKRNPTIEIGNTSQPLIGAFQNSAEQYLDEINLSQTLGNGTVLNTFKYINIGDQNALKLSYDDNAEETEQVYTGVYDLTLKMLKTDPNLASYKKVFEAMYPSYSTLIPGSFSGKVVGNTYVNDRAGIKFYIPSGFVITKDSWVASNLGTYTKAKGGVIMVKPLFSNDLTDDITNPMIEITNSQMPLSSSVPTIEDGFRQIDSIVRSNSIPGFQVESGTVPSTKFNVDATGHVDYPYLGYRVSLKTTASHMNVIYTGSYDIIFHFGQNLLDNLPQFDEIYKDINLIRTSLQVY